MKKMFLTIILVLILMLSSVLIYHIVTDNSVDLLDQTTDVGDYILTDLSVEIDEVLLDEDYEIEIGEII